MTANLKEKVLIVLALLGMAIVLRFASGCSSNSTQQSANTCMIVEAGICAQIADPMTNRTGNGQCLQQAAQTCGIIPYTTMPTPTPTPAIAPKS